MNTAYHAKSSVKTLTGLKVFTVLSFIVTSVLGSACHFAFDFFGQSRLIAPFVPVNESTWEHLKLLFFPFLLCLIAGCLLGFSKNHSSHLSDRNRQAFLSCYLDGAAFGQIFGMVAIVVLFYTIHGLLGFSIDWINIGIYFISTAYAHYMFYRYASMPYYNTFSYNQTTHVPIWIPILVILGITALFVLFTFYTPQIALFLDPTSGTYGLPSSLSRT